MVRKATEGIDIVFHLASLISIPYSYTNPSDYFDVNVKSILNILENARELSTDLVVHTSTSEVYGTAQYVPIDEKHPLQGQSPYSASKIAADKVVESFYLSYEIPVITIRPFNTFGPRQSTRAIIPTIIKQLLKGSDLKLGDLSPTRDFLYVIDTANSFVKSAENAKELIGKTFNVGTGKEITIKKLAEAMLYAIERRGSDKIKMITQNAYETARRFDWAEIADRYIGVYRSLLEERYVHIK